MWVCVWSSVSLGYWFFDISRSLWIFGGGFWQPLKTRMRSVPVNGCSCDCRFSVFSEFSNKVKGEASRCFVYCCLFIQLLQTNTLVFVVILIMSLSFSFSSFFGILKKPFINGSLLFQFLFLFPHADAAGGLWNWHCERSPRSYFLLMTTVTSLHREWMLLYKNRRSSE